MSFSTPGPRLAYAYMCNIHAWARTHVALGPCWGWACPPKLGSQRSTPSDCGLPAPLPKRRHESAQSCFKAPSGPPGPLMNVCLLCRTLRAHGVYLSFTHDYSSQRPKLFVNPNTKRAPTPCRVGLPHDGGSVQIAEDGESAHRGRRRAGGALWWRLGTRHVGRPCRVASPSVPAHTASNNS